MNKSLRNGRKKILFIQPKIDQNAPRNIRTRNFLKHLKDHFSVDVLCFNSSFVKQEVEGVNFIRLSLSPVSKYVLLKGFSKFKARHIIRYISGALNRILQQFLYPDPWTWEHGKMKAALKKLDKKYDYLVASVLPFSSAKFALDVKKTMLPKASLILDIGDPLSFNAVGKNNHSEHFEFEKRCLTEADFAVVTNEGTKEIYMQKFNISGNKILVVPQGVEIDQLENTTTPNTPVSKKNTIIYAGAFYPKLRDPSDLIQVLSSEYVQEFQLKIYGSLVSFPHLEISENINVLDKINHQKLFEEYKKSKVLLFIDNAYGVQTSGKIYELLALKKPILFIYSDPKSLSKKMCENYSHILFIKNDIESIQEGLPGLSSFLEQTFEMDYDVSHFSWAERTETFKLALC